MRYFLIIVAISILGSCAGAKQPKTISVDLHNRTGDRLGTATLVEHPEGVQMTLKVEGLTPGFHGIHIHETGKCEGPTFESAGNHLNPEDKEHGLLHPKGPHLGDLPNILVDDEGKVDEKIMIRDTTLMPTDDGSLTKNEGTAIIITSDPDDGMTQISGNSGERIVCGEIRQKNNDKAKP